LIPRGKRFKLHYATWSPRFAVGLQNGPRGYAAQQLSLNRKLTVI